MRSISEPCVELVAAHGCRVEGADHDLNTERPAPPGTLERGAAVRIMTGAPMPPGTDTVVMQEQAEKLGDARVRIDSRHRRGQNVRQAGEDIPRGSSAFAAAFNRFASRSRTSITAAR